MKPEFGSNYKLEWNKFFSVLQISFVYIYFVRLSLKFQKIGTVLNHNYNHKNVKFSLLPQMPKILMSYHPMNFSKLITITVGEALEERGHSCYAQTFRRILWSYDDIRVVHKRLEESVGSLNKILLLEAVGDVFFYCVF